LAQIGRAETHHGQTSPDRATPEQLVGTGDLLAWLATTKDVSGTGIEQDKQKAAHCISRGLSVLQGDLNEEVDDYPDCSFDYVILSQTLQQVFEPAKLLCCCICAVVRPVPPDEVVMPVDRVSQ